MKILWFIVSVSLFYVTNLTAQNVDGFLRANGTRITNDSGEEYILRGMGPGGWMLQEGYMFGTQVGTQHEIREMLESLTDKSTTDAFYDSWLDNFFTSADVALVSSWGFNSIRVPLHYNLFTLPIEDEPVLGENTWLDKGFTMVDNLLSWCEENDLYLILDLHGAPGGQGKNADISDYNPSKPSLWESSHNQTKMVALWGKLSERYSDKTHIGGYDLLNETNWDLDNTGNDSGCTCNENTPLLNLYKDVIDKIRQYDNHHIIFIEGNCWANNFNGLESLATYDSNIAFSFHKYWTYNNDGVIGGLLDMRTRTNVPLYLGETGENSNTWLTEMVEQMERIGIGWSTWAYKQIDIDDPYTILSDKWKAITDYNPGNGTNRPTEQEAREAMAEMLDNILTANCKFNPDVIHALTGSPMGEGNKAIKEHSIPGIIFATDYDMGKVTKAWYDPGYQTLHVNTGEYVAWNQGYLYRNDGIDIETCSDKVTNGYNVGWTDDGEWMKFSIASVTEGFYNITFRVAAYSGKINMRIDNQIISTQHITTPHTGGYQSWQDVVVKNVFVPSDTKEITVFIIEGGFNLNYIQFDAVQSTDIKTQKKATKQQKVIRSVISSNGSLNISLCNDSEKPLLVHSIEIIDMKGRIVSKVPMQILLEESTIVNLPSPPNKGVYLIRLKAFDYEEKYKIIS